MKDNLLALLLAVACAACSSSSVDRIQASPGVESYPLDHVDLETPFLAEAPTEVPVRDLAFTSFESTGVFAVPEEEKSEITTKEEEEAKRHEVSGIIGYTTERGDGGFTLGVDYAYLINERFSFGGAFEYVFGDLGVGVFTVMGSYKPIESVYLAVGPGVEWNKEDTSLLLRFGGGYEFEVGELSMGPAIYFDWVRRNTEDEGDNALFIAWRIGTVF